MTPILKISETFVNRLSTFDGSTFGRVYGIYFKNNLIVWGFDLDIDDSDNDLTYLFPAEVDVCGILEIGSEEFDKEAIISRAANIQVTDNPIFIHYQKNNPKKITTYFYLNNQLEIRDHVIINDKEIYTDFIHIKLKSQLPLSFDLNVDCIRDAFTNLRKLVTSGVMGFNFCQTKIFILGAENESVGISGDLTIAECCKQLKEINDTCGLRRTGENLDVLELDMIKKVTKDSLVNLAKKHAPICIFDKKNWQTVDLFVNINALAMVHREHTITTLYEILVESAIRHLKLLEKVFLETINENGKLSEPETFHFYPIECGHFVTNIYLKNDDDKSLYGIRKKLHQQLLLPTNRPIFRKGNAYDFTESTSNLLTNPHLGLKPTNNGGDIYLVKGKYAYYHYCQDKMDDNGWGCAYRSLQTLASWFKLQGYTSKPVPTFKSIQKCLVDIGDKPSSFVGSRQWIGSTEVSFVLETLLDVSSRILYVSSGKKMADHASELCDHFQLNGSPIMIGGGVLAHTILGVDYNKETGNVKFLILDPHYTGGEDLHVIQNKGWCGWKGQDFWKKDSYYNMCMPQVPTII